MDMIEKIHELVIYELRTNMRTDRIFILTSILLNFTCLGINVSFASAWADYGEWSSLIIFFIINAFILTLNAIVIFGLKRGKEIRIKHLTTLSTMYESKMVDKYYSKDHIIDSETRYTLYTLLVLSTAIAAVGVPLIFMFFG